MVGAPWSAQYNSLVEDIHVCLSRVEKRLADLEVACVGWYCSTWTDEQELFWKNKVSDDVLLVLKDNLPLVCRRLTSSYLRAYTDMKTNISLKKQFVQTLKMKLEV